MRYTIVCVGKLKEAFYRDAVGEYQKRLSRYGRLDIVEVADERTPDEAAPAERERILRREGERILGRLSPDAYVIALAIEGHPLDSVELSQKLESLAVSGVSHIMFVIGGSLGLSAEVTERADYMLSFSRMTFPHQLMRVILAEQIYRSCRIARHEPYHK